MTTDQPVTTPGTKYVHQLIDQATTDNGRGPRNVRIKVRCGLEGPPYGMGELEMRQGKVSRHTPKDEIRSTAWASDVTCPLCRIHRRDRTSAATAEAPA